MFLQYLDTAIGFAVVMVLFSLLIMVLVQLVVALVGMRGNNLCWGVRRLLLFLDPALGKHAGEIADAVLRHPAVGHTGIWTLRPRKATAIREAELLALLEDVAGRTGTSLDEQARKPLQEALGPIRKGLAAWFDTFMDRTTERFALRTQWWTAAFAFLLAIGLHIDSLAILRQLTADAALRSQLVAASAGVLREAEGTLALNLEERNLASRAIQALATDHAGDPLYASLENEPGILRTRQEGEAWLRQNVTDAENLGNVLGEYGTRFDEATRIWLGELQSAAARINDRLAEANLKLIADDVPDLGRYRDEPVHLAGVLLSVGLLSLGAPFWYNALRKLANLRPTLANRVEADEAGKARGRG